MVYSMFLWRKGFRRDDWVVYGVLAGGLVLHTIAMAKRGFNLNACPITNLYEATAFIMWTIVAGYLVVGAWQRFRFIGAFASPLLFILGVFACFPDMDAPKDGVAHNFSGALIPRHERESEFRRCSWPSNLNPEEAVDPIDPIGHRLRWALNV